MRIVGIDDAWWVCRIGDQSTMAHHVCFERVQKDRPMKMTRTCLKKYSRRRFGGLLFGFDTAVISRHHAAVSRPPNYERDHLVQFPYPCNVLGRTALRLLCGHDALKFFVVLFLYPETRGITLEQLQHKLGIN
jgi:hypothetical protein